MLSISVNIKNSNIMASAKSIVKLVVYALVIFFALLRVAKRLRMDFLNLEI